MITLDAEKYEVSAVWECPECEERTTSTILENIEYGWPLCTKHSPDLELELISFIVEKTKNDKTNPIHIL